MTKLFVVAGHGAGDPGACANGYTEAERVRALASRIKALGGNEVELGDMSVNWFASNTFSRVNIPAGAEVLELHLDGATASARGGHVIISTQHSADNYDAIIAELKNYIV